MKDMKTTAQALIEARDHARELRNAASTYNVSDYEYWQGYADAIEEVIDYMQRSGDNRETFRSIRAVADPETLLRAEIGIPNFLRPQAE